MDPTKGLVGLLLRAGMTPALGFGRSSALSRSFLRLEPMQCGTVCARIFRMYLHGGPGMQRVSPAPAIFRVLQDQADRVQIVYSPTGEDGPRPAGMPCLQDSQETLGVLPRQTEMQELLRQAAQSGKG